ncbi:YbaB/EbfC family nucleoid-associated protein [Lolliginicoccus suaedae]|uniref:YbaB/EbfC family nucleoid-associated protein n=1 Tax=Lolliginicoccus suaedae TaxID=2605429 RepID=UPI001658DE1F|nr:YbaB/EbfC family nucleoid-associated protein [Lolliginicoccus suaedae]
MGEQIESMLAEVQTQARALANASDAMAGVTCRACSGDGLITVDVDGVGAPTQISIDESAYRRLSPSQLGTDLVRTIAAAADRAREQTDRLFREATGQQNSLPGLAELIPGAPDIADLCNIVQPTRRGGRSG